MGEGPVLLEPLMGRGGERQQVSDTEKKPTVRADPASRPTVQMGLGGQEPWVVLPG